MIGEAIGALIGRHIDESDGEGGTAGAVTGAAAVFIGKRVVPVALGFGLLFAGWKIIEGQYNKYNAPDGN